MSNHDEKYPMLKYWRMLGVGKTDEELDSAEKAGEELKEKLGQGDLVGAGLDLFKPRVQEGETEEEASTRQALEMAEGFGMGGAPIVKGSMKIIKGTPLPKMRSTAELLRDAKKTPFGKTVVSNEETRAIKDALKKKKP